MENGLLFYPNESVSAASTSATVTKDWISGYSFDFTGLGLSCGSFSGQTSMLKANGKPAYCVELGVHANTGLASFSDAYSKLSAAQKNLLRYTLIYGYNGTTRYGYSEKIEYWATQIVCWQIEAGYYNNKTMSDKIMEAALSTNSNKAGIRTVVSKIREQVDEHETIPSFASSSSTNAKEYELKADSNGKYSVTLTDANGVLSCYQFPSSLSPKISGNSVTLTSTEPITSAKTIGIYRKKGKYISSIEDFGVMYYASSTSQDLACDLGMDADSIIGY